MILRGFSGLIAAASLVILTVATPAAYAGEWSGYVSTEARVFTEMANEPEQGRHSASISFEPEYYREFGRAGFTFTPFIRLDSEDDERTHADIRELFGLWVFDGWELGLGVRKIFWGVTESQHLVDVINQTDLVESIDGEEKLGQPMVNVSIAGAFGVLDFFVMPYFRERTFPGVNGRLRSALVVDTDAAEFESGAEEVHVDLALRYSFTVGNWDAGLSHFSGTTREPFLILRTDASGGLTLIPLYEQIDQSGLDLQWITGEWLWKLEAINRAGQGDTFQSYTGGFEYTFTGVAGSRMDLGVIAEWLHDSRDYVAFEDDVMVGARLAVNDPAGTEALLGVIQDLDSSARAISLESSRRLSDNWKVYLEAWVFAGLSADEPLYSIRDDDYLQFELSYFF